MLLAFLLIQGTPPIAVDVAGMPPQIAFVRQVAAARGWQITCEGHSGEEQVLRLDAHGADSERISEALDDRVSTSRFYYPDLERPGATCNLEPPHGSGDPSWAMAFGRETQLAPLLELAHTCGFSRARIRDVRAGDAPPGLLRQVPRGALILSAEEDMVPRYGPFLCFVQMRIPPGANLPRDPAPSSRRPLP